MQAESMVVEAMATLAMILPKKGAAGNLRAFGLSDLRSALLILGHCLSPLLFVVGQFQVETIIVALNNIFMLSSPRRSASG
jgi:hypothetical protein